MKTRDVAFGGLMISSFIVIGFIVRGNVRAVQTYMEILKTIIVAFTIRNISSKSKWIFIPACFFTCLILLPLQESLIYNVPSIVGGYILGIQKEKERHIIKLLYFFVINTLMILYEFYLYEIFTQVNLLFEYQNQATEILQSIFGSNIDAGNIRFIVVVLLLGDSFFSATVIYSLTQLIFKKTKEITHQTY